MRSIVEKVKEFHTKVSDEEYLLLCRKSLDLPESLKSVFLHHPITVNNYDADDVWPSREWYFKFSDHLFQECKIHSYMKLKVSKLLPVFYLEYHIQADFNDATIITRTLSDSSNDPYTMDQLKLGTDVTNELENMGYTGLTYAEANYVLCNLQMPENQIFGEQVLLEYAVFHDIRDVCPV